jgi:hypothetical protein
MRFQNFDPRGLSLNGYSFLISGASVELLFASSRTSEVKVYIRPKIGFCNCAADSLDDDELDRVGDKELVAPAAAAPAPGRSVDIAWMKGRSRMFVTADAARTEVVSIAFHDNCDLIVAVAAITPAKNAAEPVVIDFLNSERVLRWVKWLTL